MPPSAASIDRVSCWLVSSVNAEEEERRRKRESPEGYTKSVKRGGRNEEGGGEGEQTNKC